MTYGKTYDVIVVGAGHAGCEAALAAARMGCQVLLLAIDLDKIAAMPCSPSIGGMAKGQLVKEIDALGGQMAKVTDRTAIHFRTLNTRKGPAVRASRTQNDKVRYHVAMKAVLESTPNLDVKQAMVESLSVSGDRVEGVVDQTGNAWPGRTVVLAAGTFMTGRVHIGEVSFGAGRAGEFSAEGLPKSLSALGFAAGRMKTGTPPRLHRDSIDFSRLVPQPGDDPPKPFSFSSEGFVLPQMASHIGRTTPETVRIVSENLRFSSLYGGFISGVSARYCPSFEDKVVKFPHREDHQVILEPEGIDTKEVYVSGLGNSLPLEVQIAMVRSVPGLEEAEIMRPGYAIEYDFVDPLQLRPTLETKRTKCLFLAGQINGTSGYEEAAAQGLWAGINAALRVRGERPFVLDRSRAYMGVMVDDLVTRGTCEPYRMFTSRAEYRLMLREDNADLRLAEAGHELGLVDKEQVERVREKKKQIEAETHRLKRTTLGPGEAVNGYLADKGSAPIRTGASLEQLLRRNELDYGLVRRFAPPETGISAEAARQVEIGIKYDGYIQKQLREIGKFRALESAKIPSGFDYTGIPGLSKEIVEKLSRLRPESLGQAARVDGVTPAAISVLMVALKAGAGRGGGGEVPENSWGNNF